MKGGWIVVYAPELGILLIIEASNGSQFGELSCPLCDNGHGGKAAHCLQKMNEIVRNGVRD